jgi:hypothetical protein
MSQAESIHRLLNPDAVPRLAFVSDSIQKPADSSGGLELEDFPVATETS